MVCSSPAAREQVTRLSFVKMLAGSKGSAPTVEAGHSVMATHPLPVAESKKAREPDADGVGCEANPAIPAAASSVTATADVLQGHSQSSGPPPAKEGEKGPLKGFPSGAETFEENVGKKTAADSDQHDNLGGSLYSEESCSVCLDEYEEGDHLLQLTCGHVFHRPCINLWLKGHSVCPCCRYVCFGIPPSPPPA